MKIRLSLIFITLSFFFLSCSNGISQKGEGSVTVDLSEFIQKVSSRAADNGQTATVTLRTEGDFVTSVTETVSTSGGSITLDNLPIGKTITISLETTIAHKYFEGFSEPLKIKDGNNQVTIRLARNGISTDYVLYNYDSNSGTYNYFLASSPNASVPEFSEYNTNKNLFCFDNDGYFYYIDGNTIHSDNPKFTSDGVSTGTNLVEYSNPCVYVDSKTNELYISTHTGDLRLTKFPKLISDASSEDSVMYTSPEAFEATFNQGTFVVYDGIVYAIGHISNEGNMLVKFDLSDVTAMAPDYFRINQGAIIDSNWNSFGFALNAEITDMLYQNGAVYMLVRDFDSRDTSDNEFNVYSRGFIIKYDVTTGLCSQILNLVPTKSLTTFKAACTYNGTIVYNSQNDTDYHFEEFTCTSSPSALTFNTAFGSNLDSYLVGPQKFVALKPKKLVISDTGIAFYTTADGVLSYKNVNRIVEVDLKTLSISERTNVSFQFSSSTNYTSNNTSGLPVKEGVNLTGTYKWNTSGWFQALELPAVEPITNGLVCPFFVKDL